MEPQRWSCQCSHSFRIASAGLGDVLGDVWSQHAQKSCSRCSRVLCTLVKQYCSSRLYDFSAVFVLHPLFSAACPDTASTNILGSHARMGNYRNRWDSVIAPFLFAVDHRVVFIASLLRI